MKLTLSVIKADIGSIGGHVAPSRRLQETVKAFIRERAPGPHTLGTPIYVSGLRRCDEYAGLDPVPQDVQGVPLCDRESVWSRASGEQAVAVATSRLHNIAGKYTGKDDPVMLVRVQMDFPATGEVLAPLAIGHFVAGGMRGSHQMPLMPVMLNTGISNQHLYSVSFARTATDRSYRRKGV